MPTFVEPDASQPFDPLALVTRCMESDTGSLLLCENATPPAFFDLSTGLAGELLHKLSMYRIRLAVVVPDPTIHSTRFQEFAREANTRGAFRFFPTREAAVDWLEKH
jgi:hypothetical protein